MTITNIRLKTVLLTLTLFLSLAGSIGASEAHILIIGDSLKDYDRIDDPIPVFYEETNQLAADLRAKGYPVLDLYWGEATTENILKGMYGADAVIYAGHGGYQTGHYDMNGGTATPPFALTGSNGFIWGIGEQMREGWSGDLFTAPFKEGIPVFLLHACFSTGWVENHQVANPIATIYNFAQMFNGAGANYYATAWNGAEIIYDFLNGADNFQDANNQNYEKIVTSTTYNGVQVWRNTGGYAAFVGDWNGLFPSVAQTTAYDESAADAWYHGDRQIINNFYVDTNNGNDLWDGTSATYMGGTTGPMKTITATLNSLTFFGTINVASGTYNENIVVDKKINLIGSGVNAIITPLNAENPIITINSGGSGTTVRGFFLNGASTPSAVSISGASSCTISSNEISGSDNGVYLEGGSNHNIKDNTITQGSSGVTVKNSKNVKIEDNRITSNTGTGVTVNGSNGTTIQRNNISNNQNGVIITANSNSNVVADNTINDNQDSGIEVQKSQNNRISHNNIQNNVQTGIKLDQSNGNTINNGNNIFGSNIAIDIQNSNNNNINGNSISAKNIRIRSSASTGNTITSNKIFFEISQITNAAMEVALFVDTNNRLPDNVVISGVKVSMPSFLELLSSATFKINNKDKSPVKYIICGSPSGPKDSQVKGDMSLVRYVDIARRLKAYMDSSLRAPSYMTGSNLGTYFGYHNLIYTYSRILWSYNNTGQLPDTVKIFSWSNIVKYTGAFTVDQTADAAVWVKNYIETNQKLPSSVLITGTGISGITITKKININAFLELLATVTLKINNNDLTSTVLAKKYVSPSGPKDSQVKGDMSLVRYVDIARRLKAYMDSSLRAPSYMTGSNLGTYFGYHNLIYTYSRILWSYNNTGQLPDTVKIFSWNFIVKHVGTFTVDQTADAAVWVKNYVEANHKLPSAVSITGNNLSGMTITRVVDMNSFLELLATVTLKINNNDFTSADLVNTYLSPSGPKDSQVKGDMSLVRYVDIARRLKAYMDSSLRAPSYMTGSNLGTYFGYHNLIYTYSKILDTYNTNGALPDPILVRSWKEICNPISPSSTVKLTFIHHSCGSNWLANGNGNLGAVLNANNYYVTDTNYGWCAEPDDNLGDHTNTEDWYLWFNDVKMPYVYNNNAETVYTNNIANPGGENEIIMFKSCYPLSEVGSSINDEKTLYNNLKAYFAAHPDKMFILITPPGETTVSSYRLTRDLCNWLVDTENGWLSDYTGDNVYVFDFYCVLSEVNSHHRWYNGQIQHVYASDYDGVSPYHNGDDHPNSTGNQKATNEFITFLNYAYNQWKN